MKMNPEQTKEYIRLAWNRALISFELRVLLVQTTPQTRGFVKDHLVPHVLRPTRLGNYLLGNQLFTLLPIPYHTLHPLRDLANSLYDFASNPREKASWAICETTPVNDLVKAFFGEKSKEGYIQLVTQSPHRLVESLNIITDILHRIFIPIVPHPSFFKPDSEIAYKDLLNFILLLKIIIKKRPYMILIIEVPTEHVGRLLNIIGLKKIFSRHALQTILIE